MRSASMTRRGRVNAKTWHPPSIPLAPRLPAVPHTAFPPGAHVGPNREAGESPARSRHCERKRPEEPGRFDILHRSPLRTARSAGRWEGERGREGAIGRRPRSPAVSQETCPRVRHRKTRRRRMAFSLRRREWKADDGRMAVGPGVSRAGVERGVDRLGQSPAAVELPPVDVPVPAAPPPPESPLVRDPTGLTTVVDVGSRRAEISTVGMLVERRRAWCCNRAGASARASSSSSGGLEHRSSRIARRSSPERARWHRRPEPGSAAGGAAGGGAPGWRWRALRRRSPRGRGEPRHPERRRAGRLRRPGRGQLRDAAGERERVRAGAWRLGAARAARRPQRRRLSLRLRPARRDAGQQSEHVDPAEQPGDVGGRAGQRRWATRILAAGRAVPGERALPGAGGNR